MPLETPQMMEIVPVGAMVVTVALRMALKPCSLYMLLSNNGKLPRASASSSDA